MIVSEKGPLNRAVREGRAQVKAGDLDAAADAILVALQETAPAAPPDASKSLVLGGCMRSGKTILAQRLAHELACPFLPGDWLRRLYWSIEDGARRNRLRRRILWRILQTAQGGLITEGIDYALRNQGPRGGGGKPSMRLLRRIRRAGRAEVAVVGNADTSVADKVRALEAWRATGNCWTTGAAHAGRYAEAAALEKLARNTIERSRVLREKAEAAGIAYLEIRPDAFEADIAAHLATLRARLVAG